MPNFLKKSIDLLVSEWTLNSRLAKELNLKPEDIRLWKKEASAITSEIQQQLAPISTTPAWISTRLGMHNSLRGQSLYILYRALKPSLVVETGVASGISSFFALEALHKNNNHGRLVSLDLPNTAGEEIPGKNNVGWLVPEKLKKNWDLRLGPSQEILPKLCTEFDGLDVFFHDSLHTQEHMLWEYRTAWPHIKKNGLLISDDISVNEAFDLFVNEIRSPSFKTYHRFGWIHKN